MSALVLDRVGVELAGTTVVREVSLSIADGEWAALIGPNGAGKTTLLRAVAGLTRFHGSVMLDGLAVEARNRREVARRVALVPQLPETPPEMTVAEYVLLGRTPHIRYLGGESAADLAVTRSVLARLELEGFAGRVLGSLSGGERQRVVLARALAQEAPLLLLDEPTSALDIGHQQQVLELVETLRREDGITVLCAMHDLTLAGQYADRLLLLVGGELVAEGTPAEVLRRELLEAHYDASVRIVDADGALAVVPARRR